MLDTKLYYTPPDDELFEELKKAAIEVWLKYDDEFGYATGKINRIKNIANIKDNFMYMVAMFDYPNQKELAEKLSSKCRREVRVRMLNGGHPTDLICF